MRTTPGRPLARRGPSRGIILALATIGAGCGDDGSGGERPSLALEALLAIPCEDAPDEVYGPIDPPTDWNASRRGEIVGCAFDRRVRVGEMEDAFGGSGNDFVDPGISTDVEKLRVLYWTERFEGQPVLTSAAVYVPVALRGDPAPVVVLGHGSVGLADQCAPSREDPDGFDKDWKALAYTYAGDGWLTIMPDFPGLGTAGLHAWVLSADEGHAILDATRAIRRLLLPDAVSDRNAFVGHSNGGHAVLSAQSFAAEYGTDGDVASVVALNPQWTSNAAWGALLTPLGAAFSSPTLFSLTAKYFAGHLAAYEGEEAAWDAFLPAVRSEVADLYEGGCWSEVTGEAGLPSLGIVDPDDLYLAPYIEEVGPCALVNDCDSELAETWFERWAADRPPMDPGIPILHMTGQEDRFVTPNAQQCGVDRMEAEGADLTLCVQPGGNHAGTVALSAGYLRAHLEEVLLDGPTAGACDGQDQFDPAPVCDLPLPNRLEPGFP